MMEKTDRYQIRYAAGQYWLLDMEQSGSRYQSPVCMNESGAFILEQYLLLHSKEKAADKLREHYGVAAGEALEDVKAFLQNLEEQGVSLSSDRTEE